MISALPGVVKGLELPGPSFLSRGASIAGRSVNGREDWRSGSGASGMPDAFFSPREDETMRIPSIVTLLVIAAPLLPMLPRGAHAQPLDLKAAPPARERIAPAVPERDLYPQRPSVPHRPNFFGPGRAGITAFTAPNSPVGSRSRQAN